MNALNLQGMGVALVTPFTPDGDIDYRQLALLLDRQIGSGADFIVVLGTTGETPTLTADERRDVQHFAARHVAGRVPLVIGKGGNCTAAVIEELTHGDLDGYCAVLSVAPYYNKPNQEGLYRHFKAIADASPLPVILYNVPGRTGVNIAADTTLRLAEHPNIAAIKEASGNVGQAESIIGKAPEGFTVFSGDDALTVELMSRGARGVISVVGNACPRLFSTMVHHMLAGRTAEAAAINSTLTPLYPLLFADGNPAGIKCLLNTLDPTFCPSLRLPLTEVSEETAQKISDFARKVAVN